MADQVKISHTLAPDVIAAVEGVAGSERRTRSNMIETLLVEALTARRVPIVDPGHASGSQVGQSMADTPIPDATPAV